MALGYNKIPRAAGEAPGKRARSESPALSTAEEPSSEGSDGEEGSVFEPVTRDDYPKVEMLEALDEVGFHSTVYEGR